MMKYDVLKRIGGGQFGSAFMVRHHETGEVYCMKQIGLSSENEQSAMKEAASLSKLAAHNMKNVNVIQYREAFIHNDYLCIITELCENGDLHTEIKRRAQLQEYYSEGEVMEIFVQILLGLCHVHNNKIVHRDLKAQNIFISRGGVVKLGDLGISKALSQTMEQCKSIVGTPYYMAPEVCQNMPYSSKADVWSLGCILYELCMLRHAFNAESLFALLFQIMHGKYEALPEERYSTDMAGLLSVLLQHDPETRPSCKALLQRPYVQKHIEYTMHKTAAGQLLRSRMRPQPRAQHDQQQSSDVPHMPKLSAINSARPPRFNIDISEMSSPEAVLTPKQRMEARKRTEADLRLQQMKSHMDVHSSSANKQQADNRKAHMIRGSLHGGGLNVTPRRHEQLSCGAHAPQRPPPLSLSPEHSACGPVATSKQCEHPAEHDALSGKAWDPLPWSGHKQLHADMSAGGLPDGSTGFSRSSGGKVADERSWGLQSRQIQSRFAPHVCASPLSHRSARSLPGEQGFWAQESPGSVESPVLCDVADVQGGGTSDLDVSPNKAQHSLSSLYQQQHQVPVIRFGMDTKDRARERALCSPSSDSMSQHSASAFSRELACLSPASSPGAIRFGTGASFDSGHGFVLPAKCGGPAEQDSTSAPSIHHSDDISENYSEPEVRTRILDSHVSSESTMDMYSDIIRRACGT